MKIILSSIILAIFCVSYAEAEIRGVVRMKNGDAVQGAYVFSRDNTLEHTLTDANGVFILNAETGSYVGVRYSDYETVFRIEEDGQLCELSEGNRLVQTGFGARNDVSTTAAVSRLDSERLSTFASNDVWQTLYGTLPGLVALEQVAWSSKPTLYVRGGATTSGKTPLIVIDGFVRSADNLSVEEIESITVLKDGVGTALYGTQGANGVICITTKRGHYKSMEVAVDYKFGMGVPYDMPTFVDGATYAQATNEALANDGLPIRYTDMEIEAFRTGTNRELYPDVDWLEEGLRDFTTNHQFGLTFQGGGNNVRYYTHVDYQNDMGLLKNTELNDKYSTQLRKNKLSLRVNLDVDLTRSTRIALGLSGLLHEAHRAMDSGTGIAAFYRVPSNAFPVRTASGKWGGSDIFSYNPIANIVDVGYFNDYTRQLQSDLRLTQDFSFWVKGLSASVAVAWDNMASFQEGNKKTYSYEVNVPVMNSQTGEILAVSKSVFGEDSPLTYWSSLADQLMNSTLEADIRYGRGFGAHSVNAALIYRQESSVPKGRNSTRKYQNLLFTAGYSYDDRYFVDVVGNYYGASVLLDGDRFTFYPAVSAAWMISNESFMQDVRWVDFLKLRASYGRSGFTGFGYELDREYYVAGKPYYFTSSNSKVDGMKEGQLPVASLKNQISDRYNIGVDAGFLSRIDLTVDAYYERRSRIFQATQPLYSYVLGITPPAAYDGIVDAKGVEATLNLHKRQGDFRYELTGMFSFARTSIVNDNQGPVAEPYLRTAGTRLGQFFGLEAVGFFEDEEDILHSPTQEFSAVKPGDVKYRDRNGDGVVNANDRAPMGYSTLMPEIYYGLNVSLSWKGLGMSLQFQGTGNYSAVLDTEGIYRPMANNANLSEWYWSENVRWTPETKHTANLPRLSTQANPNNTQNSSLWLVDASYFSLRNAYLYYNLPARWCNKLRMSSMQIYLRGENLFRLDHIKYSNPDHIGALYPDLRMFYAGVNFTF